VSEVETLLVLEDKSSEVSLKALLKEHGLLSYVMGGLVLVFVNGKLVEPSEVGLVTVSPKDEVIVLPLAQGG